MLLVHNGRKVSFTNFNRCTVYAWLEFARSLEYEYDRSRRQAMWRDPCTRTSLAIHEKYQLNLAYSSLHSTLLGKAYRRPCMLTKEIRSTSRSFCHALDTESQDTFLSSGGRFSALKVLKNRKIRHGKRSCFQILGNRDRALPQAVMGGSL